MDDLLLFFEEKPAIYPAAKTGISDIKGLDEEPFIEKALRIGWMRNFPDGQFYPHDGVKRFQYALILFRVSKTLPLLHDGSKIQCELEDISRSHYAYEAIVFSVSKNLIKSEDGYFRREKYIRGYEAARSLSSFRKMLKK